MERQSRQYILSTINQTSMLYLVYWIVIEFTAAQTEVPNNFTVTHREVTKEIQLLSRSEAETQYAKMKALAPYIGAKSVTFDSVIICKPGPKNTIITINGNRIYYGVTADDLRIGKRDTNQNDFRVPLSVPATSVPVKKE